MARLDRREFLATTGAIAAAMAIEPTALGSAAWRGSAPLKVGVVGAGRQGRAILGELGKINNVVVAAICDSDERRLRSGLRRSSDAEGYASVDEMLGAGGLDAVAIATPTHTHRAVAEHCLARNLHAYIECPLAHTPEDCSAIASAARASSGVVAAGFQGRSNPVYSLARSFYRTDSVRKMITMRAQRHRKTSWITPSNDAARYEALNWRLDPERSLGLAGEWGAQQFDVFHWYTGAYPSWVRGTGAVRAHDDGREVADTINLELGFADGAVLLYQASLGASYEGAHEVFFGLNASIKLAWTHGWMFKEADAPTQGWEVYATRQQFHNDEGITLIADATKLASQGKLKEGVGLPNPPLYYALGDWITAIGERTEFCVQAKSTASGSASIALSSANVQDAEQGEQAARRILVDIDLPVQAIAQHRRPFVV